MAIKKKKKEVKGTSKVKAKAGAKKVVKSPAVKVKKKATKKPGASKAVAKPTKVTQVLTPDFAEMIHEIMTHGVIAAPSQPLEYTVVEAPSRLELIKAVSSLMYVLHDGSVWIPLGGSCESNKGNWSQALGRFE